MVIPTPKLGILINKQGFICEKEDIKLAATSNMKTKYHWKVPNGQSQFSDNISLPRISSKDHGLYWLIGENEYGCFDSVSKLIDSKGNPTANLEMDQFGCDKLDVDPSAIFRDKSIGSTQRWLYREDTLINEFKEQSQVLKQNPGTYRYKLVVKNQYNCFDSTSFNFTIFPRPDSMYLPTAFTPNNDKLNNYYKPIGNIAFKKYRIRIFNRWGEQLYDSKIVEVSADESIGSWDGQFMGKMVQEGVYVVILEAYPECGATRHQSQTFHMLR
jgi:gliding motility-associated-like protein